MPSDEDVQSALLRLIDEDESGLLELSDDSGSDRSDVESLIQRRIRSVIEFVESHSRLPVVGSISIIEHQLAVRLKQIQDNPQFTSLLSGLDLGGVVSELLTSVGNSEESDSLDDEFGLLNDPIAKDIATLKHVPKNHRLNPNNMERRTRCIDFHKYEEDFSKVQSELASSKRCLREFQASDLKKGDFFVLSGVLGLLVELDIQKDRHDYDSGIRNRTDGRTMCVFENGTQSSMLYRSLQKALSIDGFLLSSSPTKDPLVPVPQTVDQSMGFIYVLRTLNSKFRDIPNLHKIGYTAGLVSTRIANAESQATYLFSGVHLLSTYRCYNIDAGLVEDQIHEFFSASRLDLEVRDTQGQVFRPREWFIVQLDHINRAIELLADRQLDNFNYHAEQGCVLRA